MHFNSIFSALALALPVYSLGVTAGMGCYSDVESFENQGPYTYQSHGYCQDLCSKKDFKIAALTRGTMCYCGNKMPSDSAKVADEKCDALCIGYPGSSCGGKDAFTVIQAAENVGAPASGASTTVTATASTAAGGIIVAPSTAAGAPTGIMTALSSTNTKSAETGSKSTASESGSTSSSPSPSPTFNAAGTVRAGSSLIGAAIAGMGLLL
ncbi:uncharacterized protein N7515_007996 [Penicillium bovifimosum]|uniref:WSC domain-containing protein n=1 Tax=Penicillium bovifimosum TaxID=126998 RepID=A0A9W9GM86_9EURO|nr:uncharacterized protein N7515_007996 [Penicillium bovifimosum]KAJ5124171.1 hypothetical protein N7515_007996 [Penicillium bovifimosum]